MGDAGNISGKMILDLGQWTRSVNQSLSDLERIGKAVEQDLQEAARAATQQMTALGSSVSQAAGSIATIATQAMSAARGLAEAEKQGQYFADLHRKMNAIRVPDIAPKVDVKPVEDLSRRLERINNGPIRDLVREFGIELPAAAQRGAAQASAAMAGLSGRLQPALNLAGLIPGQFGAMASRAASFNATIGGQFPGIASKIGAVGTAALASVAAIALLGVAGLKSAAQMEQASIAFTTMTGSADRGTKLLKDLRAFADTTPFQFPEIVAAGKQLLGMGIAADDVVGSLRMLGDVGSGVSAPIGDLAYLFGQIKSQGRAMTQDLNQFAGRGIPIYKELAAVLGTNEAGVREFAESGKIGFAEIEAAFKRMTGSGGQFYNLTEKQSKSLGGLSSTLGDAWTSLTTRVGESLVKHGELKGLIETITKLIVALPAVVGPAADFIFGAIDKITKPVRWLLEGITKIFSTIDEFTKTYSEEGAKQLLDESNRNARGFTAEEKRAAAQKAAERAKERAAKESGGDAALPKTAKAAERSAANAAQKQERDADRDAAREKTDRENSLARAAEANLAAQVQALKNANREAEADLLQLRGKFAEKIQDAKTNEERIALQNEFEQERLALTVRFAEQRKAVEDKSADEAKQRMDRAAKELADSQRRAEDFSLQATITVLEAQGKKFEATLVKLNKEWGDKIAKATSPEEKTAATAAFNAEKAALVAEEKKRRAESANGPDLSSEGSIKSYFDGKLRSERARSRRDPRAISRLERDRGDALRKFRKGGLVDPIDAIANSDLAGPIGKAFDRTTGGVNATGAAQAAVNRFRGASTPQSPNINVTAPRIDEGKLAVAIAAQLIPVIDERIAAVRNAANANRYRGQVAGGL